MAKKLNYPILPSKYPELIRNFANKKGLKQNKVLEIIDQNITNESEKFAPSAKYARENTYKIGTNDNYLDKMPAAFTRMMSVKIRQRPRETSRKQGILRTLKVDYIQTLFSSGQEIVNYISHIYNFLFKLLPYMEKKIRKNQNDKEEVLTYSRFMEMLERSGFPLERDFIDVNLKLAMQLDKLQADNQLLIFSTPFLLDYNNSYLTGRFLTNEDKKRKFYSQLSKNIAKIKLYSADNTSLEMVADLHLIFQTLLLTLKRCGAFVLGTFYLANKNATDLPQSISSQFDFDVIYKNLYHPLSGNLSIETEEESVFDTITKNLCEKILSLAGYLKTKQPKAEPLQSFIDFNSPSEEQLVEFKSNINYDYVEAIKPFLKFEKFYPKKIRLPY